MTQNPEWHAEAIARQAAETLHDLGSRSILANFYLAGGTGLALHLGHRRSVDLDFFSPELFHEEVLLQKLTQLSGVAGVVKAPHTLHATVRHTKVSFLGYEYPVLFPLKPFLAADVADPRDIAAMKISAIASRGTKRNFMDLYVASERYGLPFLFEIFQQKFARARYSMVHVLKALTYFDDAAKDPTPDLLMPISWEHVQRFFTSETPSLL